MTGTALSVSWLALLIAIAGYVLKRWWDNADSIMEHRRASYSNYFAASYDLAREVMHRLDEPKSEAIAEAYERFQKTSPAFLLHASPTALIISDEFYGRLLTLRDADRSKWTPDQKQHLVKQLSDALGTLREQLKSELFLTQPRFQYERFRHRKAWARLNKSTEKFDRAVADDNPDK